MLQTRQPAVRPQFLIAASSLLLIVAPSVIVWLILRYGVNTIVWDQIEIGKFLVRNSDRAFPRLSDLFAQHNESRKVFPRILFFYLARLTHWNVKYEMAVSFLMACGVAANITALASRALASRVLALTATALCAMLIFSPVQWWNWLFGIQVVVFAPILMLTTALVVFQLRWPLPLRVAVMALTSIVATFSYANGMLLWLVLLVPLLTLREHRWPMVTAWTATAALSMAIYFHDYQKPHGHPALASPLADPIQFAAYVLAFLGHPLSWARSVPAAVTVGVIVMIAFLVLSACAVRWRVREAAAPIAIGLYAVASAGATAFGRLGLTLSQALEPRYMTFSIYLGVALILLTAIVAQRVEDVKLTPVAFGVVVLFLAHVLAVRAAWPEMVLNHRERLLARSAVQFALVSPDRAALAEFVWPYTAQAVATIDQLSRIRYIDPGPLRSDVISRFIGDAAPRYGSVERIVPSGRGFAAVSGWASLPRRRVADAVLLTRSSPDGEHLVAMSIRTALERPDIAASDPALLHSGWLVRVPASLLRSGTTLSAWSWDSSAERAYRLAGGIKAD